MRYRYHGTGGVGVLSLIGTSLGRRLGNVGVVQADERIGGGGERACLDEFGCFLGNSTGSFIAATFCQRDCRCSCPFPLLQA